jgi:membrane protease YdiL (CAAX protease family)
VPESLRPDEPSDRPLTPLAGALWAVALTMLVMAARDATEAARPGAQTDIVNLAACQVLATSLVIFAMVRMHARDVSLRATLGLRPVAPLHALLSVAAGAGLFPLTATVNDWIMRRWPIDDPHFAEKAEKLLTSSPRVVLVIAALAVVPVAGEVFFRGILYGGIRAATNVQAATIATAVFYACSDLDPQQMPTALVLGFAMAWLRERAGTVLAPIIAQLAYGAVVGIPWLRGRDPTADFTYPPRWIAGGAIIAVLALAAVGAGRREE